MEVPMTLLPLLLLFGLKSWGEMRASLYRNTTNLFVFTTFLWVMISTKPCECMRGKPMIIDPIKWFQVHCNATKYLKIPIKLLPPLQSTVDKLKMDTIAGTKLMSLYSTIKGLCGVRILWNQSTTFLAQGQRGLHFDPRYLFYLLISHSNCTCWQH